MAAAGFGFGGHPVSLLSRGEICEVERRWDKLTSCSQFLAFEPVSERQDENFPPEILMTSLFT